MWLFIIAPMVTLFLQGCTNPGQGTSPPASPVVVVQPSTALAPQVSEPQQAAGTAPVAQRVGKPSEAKPTPVAEATVSDLTHLPIKLGPSYHQSWTNSYASVAANPAIRDVPAKMRAVLEAAGDPRERLFALNNELVYGGAAWVRSGAPPDDITGGLDYIVLDLQIMFYRDLAATIAQANAPKAERLDALNRLVKMVYEPPPVGLPEPNKRLSRTITAQFSAQIEVRVHIEALEQSSD